MCPLQPIQCSDLVQSGIHRIGIFISIKLRTIMTRRANHGTRNNRDFGPSGVDEIIRLGIQKAKSVVTINEPVKTVLIILAKKTTEMPITPEAIILIIKINNYPNFVHGGVFTGSSSVLASGQASGISSYPAIPVKSFSAPVTQSIANPLLPPIERMTKKKRLKRATAFTYYRDLEIEPCMTMISLKVFIQSEGLPTEYAHLFKLLKKFHETLDVSSLQVDKDLETYRNHMKNFFVPPTRRNNSNLIHLTDSGNSSTRSLKQLSLYYQNVRGLRTKTNEIHKNSLLLDFDVYLLSETWLHNSIDSLELFDHSYVVFRKDRLHTVSDNVNIPKGGGVLLALKNIFNASEFNLSQFPSLEVVAIKIRFAKKSLFFICCYIPPNSSCETYHNLVEAVDYISSLANAEDDLIICGDFNLPHISWKSVDEENYMTPAYISSNAEATLIDGFNSYDLQQISNTFNSSGRMLDLIFTSDWVNAFYSPIFTPLTKIDNYHPPIGFSYNYDSPINSRPNISFGYNFARVDFVGLKNYFFTVDLETLLCKVPIDEAVKKFYDVVLHGYDMYVPKTRNKSIDSSPVWFSIELKKLTNKKNKAWRKYVKTQSSESYSTFINLFYSFKRMCEVSYSNYLSGCSLELKQNPKSFWKFVNSKRKSDQFPNFMTYDLSSTKVCSYLEALNNDCFPGPDNIPEIVLKQCSRVLSKPISTLFNRSISEGTFPSWWKTSFIRPVHKKGEKKNIENYRPIAKLSSIPKVFELMVYDVIYNYCSELVVPNQHGFLKMKSTVTNLVECSSKFLNTMEAGSQTDVIYTDLSKAFDLLPHNVVLFKLEKYGFPPFFIKWIGSYLCSRKYGVIFRSCTSNYFVANSGVPQGSHLGPLLFTISINDVTRVIKHSDLSIYADDMKIYRRIDSATDTLPVQRDLDSLLIGATLTIFPLTSLSAPQVSSIKDLGVVFDEKLTFRQHYNAVISKANSVLGFVKRYTKEFNDPYVIKTLFVTYIN
ncbi:uncharacterized protein LOC129612327 [Condylostylus longicornis]|uniref:uncharacterized protein LOC129612327 n=1 Tax=Condylostylus longicornis TaxID=2530218 RepID=UPI00244E4358|nr:uncharacterized protein LOC129612327 [Condylostylus longicornis]